MPSSAEIYAANERALARGAQPLEEFGNLMVGKSLGDLARSRHLEDVGSERQYEQGAAVAAAKRRMAEQAETERLMTVRGLADQGVPIKADMTMDQLAKSKRQFMIDRATGQLAAYKSFAGAMQERQQKAYNDLLQTMASKAGTPKDRAEALQAALADPSARQIPDADRRQLQQMLISGKDPQTAVQQVVQRMQDRGSKWFGWLPGMRGPGRAFNEAESFFQAYTGALQARVGPQQMAEVQARMEEFRSANKEALVAKQQVLTHVLANRNFIPSDQAKEAIDDHSSNDPNAIMAAAMANPNQDQFMGTDKGPKFGPPADEPPAPMITEPSPPSLSDTMDSSGLVGAAKQLAPSFARTAAGTLGALVGPTTSAVASAIPGSVSALGDLAATGAKKVAGMFPTSGLDSQGINSLLFGPGKVDSQAPQQLMPATPAEEAQAQAIVRLGLKRKGMSDDQANQFIQSEKAKAMAGDQASIAGHNSILKMVRNANSNPLSQNSGLSLQGQSPPAPDSNDESQ